MSKKYKVVFRMAGGTVLFSKEFVNPAGVLYCLTQELHSDAASVTVEDLETDMAATHEIKNGKLKRTSLDGIKAFLGGI